MRSCNDAGTIAGPNEAGSLQLHGDVLFKSNATNLLRRPRLLQQMDGLSLATWRSLTLTVALA